ncbi:MAG: hypothetical protein JXB00_14975 [Bacteroidales bacterium]|nr:hypothetical protein [Bacteroidales bacterium]
METTLQIQTPKLEKNNCLSGDELESMGVFPTNLNCFSYYHYELYQKGDKRVILKPLPHNLYKVIRVYDFISA